MIFIPSPIKSSKITNNRNKILSTPQPEQFGAERYRIFSFTVFLIHMRVDEYRKIKVYQPEQFGAERYRIFSFTVFLIHMRVDEYRKIKVYKYCASFNLAVLQHAVIEI